MKEHDLHPYQLRTVELMTRFDQPDLGTGVFLDPGLGKTVCALTAFERLRRTGRARRMLVIAPINPMYDTWQREPKNWEHLKHLTTTVLHGKDKEAKLMSPHDIHLINPEGVPWLFEHKMIASYDVLCIDESTKFKHPSSKRFKAIKRHLDHFEFRWCLTGTLAPNGLMDMFGQSFIMDRGARLGKFITRFKDTYFDQTGYSGYTWSPKPASLEAIGNLLAPTCLRLDATDYLDMPEFMPITLGVDLPDEAMVRYKQVERDYFAKIDGEVVVAANKAVAGNKCRQIANGAVYTEQGDTVQVHDAKLAALDRIVEETSGWPLFVMYEFQHDRKRLEEYFKEEAACITGLKGAALSQVVARFNRGSVPVLLAHPGSVAGMNIHGTCHHIVWFSIPWNLEHYIQSNWRLYRQGQKSKMVFCYHIAARGTLDEKVAGVLEAKGATQSQLERAITKEPADVREPT